MATLDNGNVQSHDQEESKLNNTIIANSGDDPLIDDKIMKSSFNMNNVATIKNKQNSSKDLIIRT